MTPYSPQPWAPTHTRKVGRFYFVDAMAGRAGFAVRNESTGYSVNGIVYVGGDIAYDFPERIPAYVRRAAARFIARVTK